MRGSSRTADRIVIPGLSPGDYQFTPLIEHGHHEVPWTFEAQRVSIEGSSQSVEIQVNKPIAIMRLRVHDAFGRSIHYVDLRYGTKGSIMMGSEFSIGTYDEDFRFSLGPVLNIGHAKLRSYNTKLELGKIRVVNVAIDSRH